MKFNPIIYFLFFFLLTFPLSSCDDFVTIDPPRTAIISSAVFDSDETTNAAMMDIYYQLYSGSFAGGGIFSLTFLTSLYSDEEISYVVANAVSTAEFTQFNDNSLKANNAKISRLWNDMYKCIYKANAVLEGLDASNGVSLKMKDQLEGEAKFIRAFCHFYLVNLWGDVPLVITTDYRINSKIPRSPQAEVYMQMVKDLEEARQQLPVDYSFANNERVRVNKGAATALLARTFLYMEQWDKAETMASEVIGDVNQYSLGESLEEVFLSNSSESILQWWSESRPNDRETFIIYGYPDYAALRSDFVNGFEPADLRRTTWVQAEGDFFGVMKYFSSESYPPVQYSTVLRLAEQYLIRAEARTKLNNFSEAQDDLNAIRFRAGLPNTTANDRSSLLFAIEQERKSELFCEWGHRWLDIKRTGRAEAILSSLKPEWRPSSIVFPLPEAELMNNGALTGNQNPGY